MGGDVASQVGGASIGRLQQCSVRAVERGLCVVLIYVQVGGGSQTIKRCVSPSHEVPVGRFSPA